VKERVHITPSDLAGKAGIWLANGGKGGQMAGICPDVLKMSRNICATRCGTNYQSHIDVNYPVNRWSI
jgi:hypothetical protein